MSEVLQRSEQEVEQIAASLGLVCFLPQDDELFIDDDSGTATTRRFLETLNPDCYMKARLALGSNGVEMISELTTTSQGGNKHRYYKLNIIVSPMERIALQCTLGSDLTKEALSVIRVRQGSTAPVALFETASEAEKVWEWRRKIQQRDIPVLVY